MKKIFYFVLSVILLFSTSVFIPACDNEELSTTSDGFEIVSEISFVNDGERITETSTEKDVYETIHLIEKDYFIQKVNEKENKNVDFDICYLTTANTSSERNIYPMTDEKFLQEILYSY